MGTVKPTNFRQIFKIRMTKVIHVNEKGVCQVFHAFAYMRGKQENFRINLII
jgi:hypothetical protein